MSSKTQFMSVVDDELDIMSLFRDALSQIDGTQVVGFTDSTLALEHFKLNQSDYSLILSDFRVPMMDGMELLNTVKAMKPSIKTVLISAFEIKDELFEKCSCVDKFLQKPITMPDLIAAVETQIGKIHLT
jgi:DNA-binding NtrC family response regulator